MDSHLARFDFASSFHHGKAGHLDAYTAAYTKVSTSHCAKLVRISEIKTESTLLAVAISEALLEALSSVLHLQEH